MAYKGFDLSGKVALVTGGNGGIGFGMADAMAESGADICIWGTRKEKTDAAVEKLKRHGRKAHGQIVDVGDEKQVSEAFAETVKVMGHVDNCVANAGVSGRGKGSILEMDYEEWRRVTRECGDDLDAEASKEAHALEQSYGDSRLESLVRSGGTDEGEGS